MQPLEPGMATDPCVLLALHMYTHQSGTCVTSTAKPKSANATRKGTRTCTAVWSLLSALTNSAASCMQGSEQKEGAHSRKHVNIRECIRVLHLLTIVLHSLACNFFRQIIAQNTGNYCSESPHGRIVPQLQSRTTTDIEPND